METINDRIEMLVNGYFDGNKAAFAIKVGVPPTTLASCIGKMRRSKPNADMLANIVSTLDVDARWLLIGESQAPNENQSTPNAIAKHELVVDAMRETIEALRQTIDAKNEQIAQLKAEVRRLAENRQSEPVISANDARSAVS